MSSPLSRRILIVSYHFPPDAEVGAVRPAKFVQHLPAFGWQPQVLTVQERFYAHTDHTKMGRSLANIPVFRVRPMASPLGSLGRLTARQSRAGRTREEGGDGGPKTPSPPRSFPFKRFASSLLRLPDDRQGWAATVVKEGRRIMKRDAIDCLMTSGPPMSTHLGGFALKRLTGAYWVADFRDPWVICRRFRDPAYRSAPCDLIEERMERAVLKAADLVVSTAPGLTRYFRSKLPLNQAKKCVTITNGYDEADFAGLESAGLPQNSTLVLRHAGSLYLGRSPEPFFAALRALRERNAITSDSLRVEFIGNGFYNNTPIAALAEKHGVASMVSIVPSMTFQDCLKRLACADALLLLAQGFPEQIPAKVFEYLRLNRPIFAVLDKGDAMDVMKDVERCFLAESSNVDRVAERFRQMMAAIAGGQVRPDAPGTLEQYERRSLTADLALYLGRRATDPRESCRGGWR